MMTAANTIPDLRSPAAAEAGSLRALHEDQRGAIMLTGLFMSCFLIGALWFVVGIGDTIVFRDKMQEAADMGAFSSAALQAKGMNFIALCNIVMLVGTVIHILLGIITDVKLAQSIYICVQTIGFGCPAAIADYEAMYRRWDSYFNVMSKGFKAIHAAQKTAAYAYPAMGVVEAYQNGSKYGGDARTGNVNVLAISSSLLPGAAARGLGNAIGGGGGQALNSFKKEGLPVQAAPFSDLCKKVISVTTTGGINLIGLGKSMGGLSSKALQIFNGIIGNSLELRYCNKTHAHFEPLGPGWDRFWGEDGPFNVYPAAKNGNVWMQTWAINMSPKLNETSESRVGIARGPKAASKYTKQEGAVGYFAQAEMYVDCDGKWGDAVCNFEGQAMYTIKWRARLRRLELPAVASGAVGAAMEGLLNLPNVAEFKKAINERLAALFGASGFGRAALKAVVDRIIAEAQGAAKGAAGGAAGGFDPTLGGLGITSFH